MKKLIMGLGLSAIVGFSAAASAGQCTKAKLQGAYAIGATYEDSAGLFTSHSILRLQLSKNGKGKVTAGVDAEAGGINGGYVNWPLRWDVAGDCTGVIEIGGDFDLFVNFVASGNPQAPVMQGVITNGRQSGPIRMEKIRF